MKKQSRKYTLSWQDVLKGCLVAAITGGLTTLEQWLIEAKPIDDALFQLVWKAALIGGIGYLTKNWLTDSNGNIVTKKQKVDDVYKYN